MALAATACEQNGILDILHCLQETDEAIEQYMVESSVQSLSGGDNDDGDGGSGASGDGGRAVQFCGSSQQFCNVIAAYVLKRLHGTFAKFYTCLRDYARVHGTTCVSQNIDSVLASQVHDYRRRASSLPGAYVRMLNGIGFAWTPLDDRWETQFRALCEFLRGSGGVLPTHNTSEPLKNWLSSQRRKYKNGRLEDKYIEILQSRGLLTCSE